MRTEYHDKLADIDKAFHEKDKSLAHEKAILQRDLEEAREDLRLYGDEIDEKVEYGMILPESISAREVYLPEPIVPRVVPVSLKEKNDEQVFNPLPMSPVHTFNEMPSIY